MANKDIGAVSDKELEDLLSQQDLGSFAESLLKQIQGEVGDIGKFWINSTLFDSFPKIKVEMDIYWIL